MKVEKLLLEAFNWYYEEGVWNTNISNEEALVLFKETENYQDFYNKASDAETSQDQALNLAVVNGSLSIDYLVDLLKRTLDGNDDIMVEFDNETDRIDFILDLCNNFRKELEKDYR